MSMKNIAFIIVSILILSSCGILPLADKRERVKFQSNRNINNNKYSDNLISKDYIPKYAENGGETKKTFYNWRKSDKERELLAAMKKLDSVRAAIPTFKKNTIESDYVDIEIQNIISKLQSEIVRLENLLMQIELTDVDSHAEITEILAEINRLKCEKIDGISLLKKKINVLRSDLMFEIGKYKITSAGKKIIKSWTRQVEVDIDKWNNYINKCNKRIFENDTYILTINIAGYADPQGSTSVNLKLSNARADAVKKEITTQLFSLLKSTGKKIVFNNIHSVGYGEKLPEGMTYEGDNDPRRRVCIVNSLIAPSKVIE